MSGQVVESTSEVRRRDRGNSYFERLKPVAALNAATSYEFVLLLGASGLVLAQFTTGLETDDEPPPAPQLTSFVPELMIGVSGGSSCLGGYMGRFGRFRTALAPLSSDTANALLLVHGSDSEPWQSDAMLPVAECVPPGFFGGGGGAGGGGGSSSGDGGSGGGGCHAANSPGTGVLALLLMWLGLRRPRSVFGRRVDQRATTSFAAGQSSAR